MLCHLLVISRLPYVLLALVLGLSQLARATGRGGDQVQLVEVQGLGQLMLVGSSPRDALESYVRSVSRRRIFPQQRSALRRWGAELMGAERPRARLRRDRPVVGIQLNNPAYLLGERGLQNAGTRIAAQIRAAGGVPVFLPPGYASHKAGQLLDQVDHLVLMGGADVHPSLYGQRVTHACRTNLARDRCEIRVIKQARQRGLGIDGICRGMQLLNVVQGGSLYQDIHLDGATKMQHRRPGGGTVGHRVKVTQGTELAGCVGAACFTARSTHHQAVRRLGRGLVVSGRTRDGLVHALETPGGWIRGYQFHPEASHNAASRGIFRDVVRRARVTRRQRGLRSAVARQR